MLSLAGAVRMPGAVRGSQSPYIGILLTAIDAIKFRHNIDFIIPVDKNMRRCCQTLAVYPILAMNSIISFTIDSLGMFSSYKYLLDLPICLIPSS